MRLLSWLRTRKPVGKRRKSVARLRVEHLEDRRCPAGYAITDLGALPDSHRTRRGALELTVLDQVRGAGGRALKRTIRRR